MLGHVIFSVLITTFLKQKHQKMNITALFNPTLDRYIAEVCQEFNQIGEERKNKLKELSQYINQKQTRNDLIQVIVICTHNSRRSHLGQVWLQVAATFYGIKNFTSFSGGTEATAFNTNAVAALQKAGIRIEKTDKTENPTYKGVYGKDFPPIYMFSKVYSHENNPAKDFAAVMVCTQANEGCPLVSGAEARFSLPYGDPKYFDGMPQQAVAYDERCKEIAREMFYLIANAGITNYEESA